jgi:DNA topoisomerase I
MKKLSCLYRSAASARMCVMEMLTFLSRNSLKKEDDPYTITYDRAVELIEEKKKAQAEKLIQSFPEDPEIQVLNGRWGPYVSYKGRNIKIPKTVDPKEISLFEIHELAEKTPITPKRKGGWRKKA